MAFVVSLPQYSLVNLWASGQEIRSYTLSEQDHIGFYSNSKNMKVFKLLISPILCVKDCGEQILQDEDAFF